MALIYLLLWLGTGVLGSQGILVGEVRVAEKYLLPPPLGCNFGPKLQSHWQFAALGWYQAVGSKRGAIFGPETAARAQVL